MTDDAPDGFRPADPTDEAALLALMRSFYAAEHLPFDPVRTPAALRTLLGNPGLGQVCVCEVDGELAGYFVLAFVFIMEFGGQCAFVDELYIVPEHRGRGHGAAALARAESVGSGRGFEALRLEVDHANPDAARLYRRAGFVPHGRAIMTKRLPGEKPGLIR